MDGPGCLYRHFRIVHGKQSALLRKYVNHWHFEPLEPRLQIRWFLDAVCKARVGVTVTNWGKQTQQQLRDMKYRQILYDKTLVYHCNALSVLNKNEAAKCEIHHTPMTSQTVIEVKTKRCNLLKSVELSLVVLASYLYTFQPNCVTKAQTELHILPSCQFVSCYLPASSVQRE